MNPALRTFLACSLTLVLLGCSDPVSVPSKDKLPAGQSGPGTHEEARRVLMNYANLYEETYLQCEGLDLQKRLEKVRDEYHERMSRLAQESKWTPQQKMGTALKLSFLIGEFHGALQSCKLERAAKEKDPKGCDEVKKLKDAMANLCSE